MHEGERVTAAVLTVKSVEGREVMAASFVLATNGRFRVLNIHPSHAATPTNSSSQVACTVSMRFG